MTEQEIMMMLGAYLLSGVRYNVIKRPLSGGKGTIVRGKATKGTKCPKCKGDKQQYGRFVCPKCKGVGRINIKPAESEEAYYSRVAEYIKTNPQDYFMRLHVHVSQADIDKFKRECLDPVLENLCDDYEWWESIQRGKYGRDVWNYKEREIRFPDHQSRHFRMPYGVYNPLLEGEPTELDEYLRTGLTTGLQTVDDLFPELKEV